MPIKKCHDPSLGREFCLLTRTIRSHFDTGSRSQNTETWTRLVESMQPPPFSVLFLSDVPSQENPQTLQEEYGAVLKHMVGLSTDVKAGRGEQVLASNRPFTPHQERVFPFRDGFFDLVLGRRVICWCEPGTGACGLPGVTKPELAVPFVRDVGRVLRRGGQACLDAFHGEEKGVAEFWEAACTAAVSDPYPDDLDLHMVYYEGRFAGVRIIPV
jgi:SAM-dependent methyltransferase